MLNKSHSEEQNQSLQDQIKDYASEQKKQFLVVGFFLLIAAVNNYQEYKQTNFTPPQQDVQFFDDPDDSNYRYETAQFYIVSTVVLLVIYHSLRTVNQRQAEQDRLKQLEEDKQNNTVSKKEFFDQMGKPPEHLLDEAEKAKYLGYEAKQNQSIKEKAD